MGETLASFIAGFTPITVIFLVLGLVLLIVEMFLPGFGIAGVGGVICLFVAIVLRATSFLEGLWMTVILLAIVGLLLLLFMHSSIKGKISKSPLILKEAIDESAGYISTTDLDFFVGKEGVALTTLRPSGAADFDGVKLDVVSEGEFITNGAKIRVISVEGRKILVRPIAPEKTESM